MAPRRINPRKLLVASVGVATINYVGTTTTACSSSDEGGEGRGKLEAGAGDSSVGNLVAPPDATVANLVAPPPRHDATVANLVAPPPHDSGTKD